MIRTVLTISWINLRRDRVALVLTFALPLVFFSIFAGVFRGMDQGATPLVETIVVLEDRGPAALRLERRLGEAESISLSHGEGRMTRDQAVAAVRAGLAGAAVVVPAEFSAALRLPRAEPLKLPLYVNTSNPMAAAAVSGALQAASFEAGLEMLAALRGAAATPPLAVDVVDVLGGQGKRPSVAFFASGIGVMFLMFAVSGRSAILLEERESGVLVRMLAARLGMTRLLLGRFAFLTLLGTAQVTAMFVWGALWFDLELWVPRHLLGFAALTPLTAAAAAAFGLLLSTLCRSRAQLNGVAAVVILILSALGGNLFPAFLMPDGLRTLGLATFNGWALAGYQKIFWYERSVTGLAPQLLAEAAFCVVFLLAARLLARRWERA